MSERDDRDLRDGWALLVAVVIAVAALALILVLNACSVAFIYGDRNEVKQQPHADVDAKIPDRERKATDGGVR